MNLTHTEEYPLFSGMRSLMLLLDFKYYLYINIIKISISCSPIPNAVVCRLQIWIWLNSQPLGINAASCLG